MADWEKKLRETIGIPVEQAAQNAGRKLDAFFGPRESRAQQIPRNTVTNPHIKPAQIDQQMLDADQNRKKMLERRIERGGDLTPEDMQYFQELSAKLLNR